MAAAMTSDERPERSAAEELLIDLGRRDSPGALRDLLAVALKDRSLRVGFWVPPLGAYIDAAGRPVVLESIGPGHVVTRITSHGEPLAVFVGDADNAADRELVEAVLGAAQAALENERLQAELRAQLEEVRASRERIVTAADAERQRIERNLHDGAQQRLVSLTMSLRTLRLRMAAGESSEELLACVDAIEEELLVAVTELRELARGIHPSLLTEEGLTPAVQSLAARASLDVSVRGAVDRAAPAVEAAAYFVCCEALTNAARHSGAERATIDVTEDGERLVVMVEDDGGGGADVDGAGLRGLADRVAALGGSLSVQSPRGGGTRVRAELPARREEA